MPSEAPEVNRILCSSKSEPVSIILHRVSRFNKSTIFSKNCKKCLTSAFVAVIIQLATQPIGPVVQLVRTPACHAGGRRFEPVPGRQYMLIWLRWQSTSLVRTRSPVRIRLSAPKSAQRKCDERLFLPKTKKVCATAHTFSL